MDINDNYNHELLNDNDKSFGMDEEYEELASEIVIEKEEVQEPLVECNKSLKQPNTKKFCESQLESFALEKSLESDANEKRFQVDEDQEKSDCVMKDVSQPEEMEVELTNHDDCGQIMHEDSLLKIVEKPGNEIPISDIKQKISTATKNVETDYDDDARAIDEVLKHLNGDDESEEEEHSNDSAKTVEYFESKMPEDDVAQAGAMPKLICFEKLVSKKEVAIEESTLNPETSSNAEPNELEMPVLLPIPCSPRVEKKIEEDIEKFLTSRPVNGTLMPNKNSDEVPSHQVDVTSAKKLSIVDSLLNKIRRNNSESGPEVGKLQQMLSESDDDLLVEIDLPVLYNQSSNPNQLATPIVNNQNSETSAFVNNEEEYQQTVANHKNKKAISIDHKPSAEEKSAPPSMQAPHMPSDMTKPRTVAERRQLVSGNSLKYLMVEQESKIFKQVQRKEQGLEIHFNYVDALMNEDIPIKTGPWKVLTWLRTRPQNYIQQSCRVDGEIFKLKGSRGNHRIKTLMEQSSKPFPKYSKINVRTIRCCPGGRVWRRNVDKLISNKSIKRFVLRNDFNTKLQLEKKFLDNQLVSIKPRPLSKKIEIINKERDCSQWDEDRAFLGDYAQFVMPDIKLEVNVEPKSSLDPLVKKYLKQILPHNDLDENWCNFALAALSMKENDKVDEVCNNFQFTIPYQNNKKSILVREILRSSEDTESLRIPFDDAGEDKDEMEWTFAKDIDKDDPVECEVVDIIKDLTNSVFINLNDNLFTQEDVLSATSESSPIKSKEAVEELSNLPKPDDNKRVMLELRRLNANVFQADACFEDENEMRRYATAHLGKEERELRPTVIVTESDTVLLGNQEKESRRIKRAPKKFEDYHNPLSKTVSDSDEPAPKKQKVKEYHHDETFKANLKGNRSVQEYNIVKNEVKKILHVRVQVYRLKLTETAPFCMFHRLYKCQCKNIEEIHPKTVFTHPNNVKPIEQPNIVKPTVQIKTLNFNYMRRNSVNYASYLSSQKEKEIASRAKMQLTAPELDKSKLAAVATLNNTLGVPKIEIQNLCDLINGGLGPIYINVYDDKTMRLHPVLRSVLSYKSAIIYMNSNAYFVDKKHVNVDAFDFEFLMKNLRDPIFIIQGKEKPPVPISTKENFPKVQFRIDSKRVIRINDRTSVNEISGIIESILRNVRKKLESKIGNNQSELVKEQLSMLTRERSHSMSTATSFSSANSSPLSFKGHRLQEAPPPGLDTENMQEFNKIFSLRMHKLVSVISSNTLGLHPSAEMLNKFYIFQWSLMLSSFEEELIHIWQATLESENGKRYQLLVLTDTAEVPDVEYAKKENIINIRKLSLSDKTSELTRMILLRVEKESLKHMTILMYGCKGYMRICGVLNSKDHYLNGFVAKPTRATYPRIAAKIQKVYHIWHQTKMKMEEKKLKGDAKVDGEHVTVDKQMEFQTRKRQREKTTENVPLLAANENKEVSKTQIEFEQFRTSSLASVGQSDFKWFLFNITSDFSDIFIKSWSRYLSFKVIMEAVTRAKKQGRAVGLVPSNETIRKWPKIYALPAAPLKFKEHESMTSNFLIFGPYTRNSNSNLLLMQNVDGELMLRDEYEKRNRIRRITRTRCLWIYANTLKCIQEADPVPLKLMWGSDSGFTSLKTSFEDSNDEKDE